MKYLLVIYRPTDDSPTQMVFNFKSRLTRYVAKAIIDDENTNYSIYGIHRGELTGIDPDGELVGHHEVLRGGSRMVRTSRA